MKKISKCEEQIMICVWDSERRPDMKSIRIDANKKYKHEWAPQTISTFLTRL